MKPYSLIWTLLCLLSIQACTESDQPQATDSVLEGTWTGTYETRQAGSCTWSGDASVGTTATFRLNDATLTATITRSVVLPKQLTGTLKGNLISLSETTNVACNGAWRSYVSRYEGTLNGNTLTLVSRDTLCPDMGCIFLRTLRLTRQ